MSISVRSVIRLFVISTLSLSILVLLWRGACDVIGAEPPPLRHQCHRQLPIGDQTMRVFVIRDSRFVAIHENSLSNRMDPNDEWWMWIIRIFSSHYSWITYESRITHHESRIRA